MASDNPAQRLFEICSQALESRPHFTARTVWGQILDIDSDDLPKIYRALGALNDLAQETREQIEKLPNIDHELYLEDLPLVEKALSPINLDMPWNNYSQHLTSGAMKGLRFCANELSKHHFESPITKQKLADLLQQVEELTVDVLDSDIDPLLKTLIIDLLETIRKSIMEYRLRGAEGIKDALIYFIGSTATNYDLVKKEKNKSVMQRVMDFVTTTDKVVSTALQMKALCENAAPLLQLLPPNS